MEATDLQNHMSYTRITPESKGDEALHFTKYEIEDLGTLESVISSRKMKSDQIKKRITNSGPTMRGSTRQKSLAPKQGSLMNSPRMVNQDVTPNQNPDTQDNLSISSILPISPYIQRHIKDQIVTKRVTATASANALSANENNVECFMSALPERTDNIIVADHSVNIRVLDVTLNVNVNVEAILDEGSQIVGIRKDIWEKLGVPICSDHKIHMISAN